MNVKIARYSSTRYDRTNREGTDSAPARGAFDAETRRAGYAPNAETTVSQTVAPTDVAEHLGIDAGAPVVLRARRMSADGLTVQIANTYVPAEIAEAAGLNQIDTGRGGMISRLAEAGHTQVRISERTAFRPATDDEAEALGVETGSLVVEIAHLGHTAEGRVVEATIHVLHPGRWVLLHEWDLNQQS
ncbi:UTRA domain-containing protein [Kitasatospora indigofera]|uniref:UTRA domain-containing protein n=1 Tax=Kitasatospora indigofera TaxID=67307 RepID=UPI0036A3EC09